TRGMVLGREALPSSPLLIQGDRFADSLCGDMDKLHLVELHFASDLPTTPEGSHNSVDELAQMAVERGEYDAVVFVPADFAQRLAAFREKLGKQAAQPRTVQPVDETSNVPSPEI